MLKKLSIIALLALVIIPTGVFAAGNQAGGAGSGTMQAGGQASGQQPDQGQAPGPYSFSHRIGFATSAENGNGSLIRDRTCTELKAMNQTRLQEQIMVQNQTQDGTGTGDQLQARIQQKLHTMAGDQPQTMTRIQSRLMDGSCGNCPWLAPAA